MKLYYQTQSPFARKVLVFALVISASAALVANLLALLRCRSVVEVVPTRVEWLFGLTGAAQQDSRHAGLQIKNRHLRVGRRRCP